MWLYLRLLQDWLYIYILNAFSYKMRECCFMAVKWGKNDEQNGSWFNETSLNYCKNYYRPPEGGRLYDMKVVSGYAFLRTYFV